MNRIARRAGVTLLLVVLLIAGVAFFLCEYVTGAGDWIIFPGSPHVYSGGNIGCGVIVDRDNTLVLDLNDQRKYSDSAQLRKSFIHWVGDRYGNISAPALSVYASELSGFDFVNGVYSYSNVGGVAELTLSAQVQQAALEAMGNYKGTIGIYNYKTGQLLCAVTTPTYDPDDVPHFSEGDSQYEGMYINRFIQSTYTPGSIFKIVTLAAALETIPDIEEQEFTCNGRYTIGANAITCEHKHGKQNIKEAFRNSCNCAFADIAQQLGSQTIMRYVQQFGITQKISFDGITTTAGKFESAEDSKLDLAWSAIGQYTDQINPCSFMTFVGTVAAGGKGVQPYLIEKISSDGLTTHAAKKQATERIMSVTTAEKLRDYMGYNVTDKYGSDNFPGMTVCAKTGTAEVGGGKKPNAMIAGFVADDAYPLAFIICVEDGGYGREICVPILSKVLAECKTVLDN